MEKTRNKAARGFTLIELLVVIAIIGILSAIVLVSLRSARNKAQDARIISSMSQIRSLAEIYYSGSSYSDLNAGCGGNGVITDVECGGCTQTDVKTLCNDIYDQNSSAALTIYVGAEYCAQATLLDGTYCVDSTGYAGTVDIFCDATFDCASD